METGMDYCGIEARMRVKAAQIKLPPGFAYIPAGEFWMGALDDDTIDASDPERPRHRVSLDAFALAVAPVTNAEFQVFAYQTGYVTINEELKQANPCDPDIVTWRDFADVNERTNHPVVCVSWVDAYTYCRWAGFRLPTEAEWEGAARGDTGQQLFPWGNEATERDACWNRALVAPIGTLPVKSFAPNRFGLYDMAGNVWEWCADWYDANYYRESPRKNPKGPRCKLYRVRRGAAWNIDQPFRMRCSNRGNFVPDMAAPNTGFRCAHTLP